MGEIVPESPSWVGQRRAIRISFFSKPWKYYQKSSSSRWLSPPIKIRTPQWSSGSKVNQPVRINSLSLLSPPYIKGSFFIYLLENYFPGLAWIIWEILGNFDFEIAGGGVQSFFKLVSKEAIVANRLSLRARFMYCSSTDQPWRSQGRFSGFCGDSSTLRLIKGPSNPRFLGPKPKIFLVEIGS